MSRVEKLGQCVKSFALREVLIRRDVVFTDKLSDDYEAMAYANFLKTAKKAFSVQQNLVADVVNNFGTFSFKDALEKEAKMAEHKGQNESFFPSLSSYISRFNELISKAPGDVTDKDKQKMTDILITLKGLINKRTGLYKYNIHNALVHALVHKLIFLPGDIGDELLCAATELIQFRTDYEETVRAEDSTIPPIHLDDQN